MKLITIACLAVTAIFAETEVSHLPVTDAEKIADALRAGPTFITKGATLFDWPSAPGGDYRVSAYRFEWMDLSPGYSWLSTRRTGVFR